MVFIRLFNFASSANLGFAQVGFLQGQDLPPHGGDLQGVEVRPLPIPARVGVDPLDIVVAIEGMAQPGVGKLQLPAFEELEGDLHPPV